VSVFHAIKDAVASVGRHRLSPHISGPATPEEVLMAIEDLKRRLAAENGRTGKDVA
ncbi:MAG: hypothetical protein GY769_10445, partial [bacterium]|nr:hypothetical protein [bacterium]